MRIRCRSPSRCGCARSARSTLRCAARRPIASSWACDRSCPAPPDLVLSGVNSGSNIADDVTYSGTVAGAMEGTLLGIRSIALSQAYIVRERGRASCPRRPARRWRPALLDRLISAELPDGIFLNLNFPNCQPEKCGAPWSPRRASSPTASGSRNAPTAAACPITGCASAANAPKSPKAPTFMP